MFLFILESLGSTELVFILVMALVFFGPRKLPQISRSLGKNIAEFRRASEDFKRTWDREVTLDEQPSTTPQEQSSILNPETPGRSLMAPSIEPIRPDQVIARQGIGEGAFQSPDSSDLASNHSGLEGATDEPKHSPKNDWL